MVRIISTLGQSLDYENSCNLIENLIKNGCDTFRYNFSKYNSLEKAYERFNVINKLQSQFGNSYKLLIDLPFPYRKPRICVEKRLEKIHHENSYYLKSLSSRRIFEHEISVDLENIGELTGVGDTIIYDDGRGRFRVCDVLDAQTVEVVTDADFEIHDKKSIYVNNTIVRNELDKKLIGLIRQLNPESVALSFVNTGGDVLVAKEMFDNTSIISKIETTKGISNIDDISKYSDVMIARGDLLFYSDMYRLYTTQEMLANVTKKNNKKLYIASGILNSLTAGHIPSQADLIDLYTILSLYPDAIVLNFPLIAQNYSDVFRHINNMSAIITGKI